MKQQLYSEDESMRFSWVLILVLALPPAAVILTTTNFKPQTSETSCEKVRIHQTYFEKFLYKLSSFL